MWLLQEDAALYQSSFLDAPLRIAQGFLANIFPKVGSNQIPLKSLHSKRMPLFGILTLFVGKELRYPGPTTETSRKFLE